MNQVISVYRQLLGALPSGGRRFVRTYSWLLASLSLLDAAALGLLAAVIGPISLGAPVVLPVIGEIKTLGIVLVIVIICVFLIGKSVLAVSLTWWAARRIPKYEVAIGNNLLRSYLAAPWRDRLRKNSVEIMRFSDSGVDASINSFLLPGATLLGEAVTLIVVIVTLAVVQPLLAFATLAYLATLGGVLFFWIAGHARKAGEVNVNYSVRSARLILEVIASMKEVTLRNKESEVADIIAKSRESSVQARANLQFLNQLPRYALDAGLVGGFLVIGGVGYLLGGIDQAIVAIGLFGLAGFRVAPSVIRFQQVLSQMIAAAEFPRQVLAEIADVERGRKMVLTGLKKVPDKWSTITCEDVTFQYSPTATPAVKNVSIEIPFGSTVAFVGASGSGKSTMVDLLLSLLDPTSGRITIDGTPLAEMRASWRSRVGYVPQDVVLFDATIAQNVALTWGEEFDSIKVNDALDQAQLSGIVSAEGGGIDSRVGERGLALSGGQRQRLGIARALYSEPLVLVLDEATSALDTTTESLVMEGLEAIEGNITKIIVAHRLATIRHADLIFFMQGGVVAGSGTFDELIAKFPDFARQATLAGLA